MQRSTKRIELVIPYDSTRCDWNERIDRELKRRGLTHKQALVIARPRRAHEIEAEEKQ